MSAPRVRRQNHSCEQCRRSRKACDGYALNLSPSKGGGGLQPCSYCTRTRKQCGFNIYWGELESGARTLSTSSDTSTTSKTAEPQSVLESKRQKIGTATGTEPVRAHDSVAYQINNEDILQDMLQSLETPSLNGKNLYQDSDLALCNTFTASSSCSSDPKFSQAFSEPSYDLASLPPATTDPQDVFYHAPPPPPPLAFDNFSGMSSNGDVQIPMPSYDPNGWLTPDPGFNIPYWETSTATPTYMGAGFRVDDAVPRESEKPRVRKDTISPYNADHSVMTTMNNTLITSNLLGIYHDVLENNLACWLAEDTCPYRGKAGQELLKINPNAVMPTNSLRQVCGATWSNRIYSRVIQLDRVAQRTGQLTLSRDENRAASKALSLAIMAFATQWAQGQRHGVDTLPTGRDSFTSTGVFQNCFQNGTHDFEENVKQSTWEQARQALQECSDLESYRVVYAELIFGLVQRPMAPQRLIGNRQGRLAGFTQQKREVMKMLAIQNQPVYVERATRKVHSMKFRLDAAESGFSMFGEAPAKLMSEDRSTIGLLYWLAVMLDTVSSSISEKPVALADEDCQHEALPQEDENVPKHNRRWEARLFVQDDLDKPSLSLRWPCSYHDAAEGVARSAPVKVLLFRYVSYLQNALRKRQSGKAVEDVIEGALLLYRYWNNTYGAFFKGLIRDYNTIPARIKSWFVCILVPWNLGSLMLADLIEFVDNNNKGLEQSRCLRIAEGLASTMRKTSADELAGIAQVTTPAFDNSGMRQLPDLHFAVNRGSLLTEPWTILLVNAFSKAAIYHLEILNKIETQNNPGMECDGVTLPMVVQQIDSCARCLWFLGRKTSVAGDIASVFFEAIGHHQMEYP